MEWTQALGWLIIGALGGSSLTAYYLCRSTPEARALREASAQLEELRQELRKIREALSSPSTS